MSDEADQKFTQLKDIQVCRRKNFSGVLEKHRWKADQAHPAHQPGSLKDVRGREEDQKDLVVAVRLLKPMDKVRRKEIRRGERDHNDLYSSCLCIAVSLNTRQHDSETPDYLISDGYLRHVA